MSTLGTFAKYSNFADESSKKRGRPKKATASAGQMEIPTKNPKDFGSGLKVNNNSTTNQKALEMQNKAKAALNNPVAKKPVSMMQYPEGANLPFKSQRRVDKGKKAAEGFEKLGKLKKLKTRNLIVGAGLGLAGLGTAGAIAYNNRNAKKTEMSAQSAYANFVSQEKKDAVKKLTQTGNPDADSAIKLVRDQTRINRRKELGKLNAQKTIEKNVDSGGDVYKGAKGAGDYINRTSALLTSPERKTIEAGKASKNSFIKGASELAEKVGKAGYKEGATGLRKVGNAIAGRTLTGKVARLGVAGIGLSAIGGAMKRKRQENQ